MSKAAGDAKAADDYLDRVQVRLLYMIRHTDESGLALLEKIRSDVRSARDLLDDIRNPTTARAKRIKSEVIMTGLEQEIV